MSQYRIKKMSLFLAYLKKAKNGMAGDRMNAVPGPLLLELAVVRQALGLRLRRGLGRRLIARQTHVFPRHERLEQLVGGSITIPTRVARILGLVVGHLGALHAGTNRLVTHRNRTPLSNRTMVASPSCFPQNRKIRIRVPGELSLQATVSESLSVSLNSLIWLRAKQLRLALQRLLRSPLERCTSTSTFC